MHEPIVSDLAKKLKRTLQQAAGNLPSTPIVVWDRFKFVVFGPDAKHPVTTATIKHYRVFVFTGPVAP